MQGQQNRKKLKSTVNPNYCSNTQGKWIVSETNRMVILQPYETQPKGQTGGTN